MFSLLYLYLDLDAQSTFYPSIIYSPVLFSLTIDLCVLRHHVANRSVETPPTLHHCSICSETSKCDSPGVHHSNLTPVAAAAQRYLQWLSVPSQTFNVGSYRRKAAAQPTADFFDTTNAEGERQRKAAAEAAVADMLKWFRDENGVVALLDATNSTKERRKWILEICTNAGIEVIYVESKCDDENLIMANIRDVKTTSPDYKGQDPEQAALDFRTRIRNYEKVYKSVNEDGDEEHLTYLKIMDVGKQVIINRIQDYLQSRVVYYLMNLHIRPRSVWLSRVRLRWQFLRRGALLGITELLTWFTAWRVHVQPRWANWR